MKDQITAMLSALPIAPAAKSVSETRPSIMVSTAPINTMPTCTRMTGVARRSTAPNSVRTSADGRAIRVARDADRVTPVHGAPAGRH